MQPLVRTIEESFGFLASQADLTPRAEVNRRFSALVNTALAAVPEEEVHILLAEVDARIGLARLRALCGTGETALEVHWAKRLAEAKDVLAELQQFPYYENYRQMVQAELELLRQYAPQANSVLLVGSGPLPLTAYFLAAEHGLAVQCLDVDDQANTLAKAWLYRLPQTLPIKFSTADIRDLQPMPPTSAVWLCALVLGQSAAEQTELLHGIESRLYPGQFLGVRSVQALRCLLYPKVDCRCCAQVEFQAVVHPRNDIINSFILLKKK
jgi:hypothetical protein